MMLKWRRKRRLGVLQINHCNVILANAELYCGLAVAGCNL